ncbi:hypothetical protein D9M69_661600 [compost metagenome]
MSLRTLTKRHSLDRNGGLDIWIWLVPYQLKILEPIVVDRRRTTEKFQLWKTSRRPGELLLNLLHMIRIRMSVTRRDDDFMRNQIALLGKHMRQQGQGSSIVRQA